FQLYVQVERAVQQPRSRAAAAVLLQRVDRGLFHFRVRDQVEVVVRPEHEHFSLADADLTRPAAITVSEYLEVHVEPGGLQIPRTGKIATLIKEIIASAGFLPAGNSGSR